MEEKGIYKSLTGLFKSKKVWFVFCIIFQVVIFVFFCKNRVFWQYGGDTWTYQITSLQDFSWYHRTVGYQLVMYICYLLGGQVYDEPSYIYVVWFQVVVAAIANLALCDSLWDTLKSKKFAVMFGIMGSILLVIYGWSEILMPESLAVSIMCIHIWVLTKALTTKKRIYFIFLAPIGLMGILLRPSYVFILAVLGVFFVIYFFFTDKKRAVYGMLSLLICTIIVLGYCGHNKKLIGVFCLSNVTYYNELTDLISGDMYQNLDYPEMTDLVQQVIDENDGNNWSKAGIVCSMADNREVVEYIKSCRKLYAKEYLQLIYQYADEYKSQSILESYSVFGEDLSFGLRYLTMLTMPFNYISMLILTGIFFLFSVVESFFRKKPSYMEIGISGCILAIYFLSVIACHTAHLQRIAICILPCMIFMEAMILDKVIMFIKRKTICGKK